MVRVAPINLTFNPRTLWFDPGNLEIAKDDPVVVRTARGTEFGVAASDVIEVSDEQVKALKTPLRPVERVATEEDVQRAAEMEEKSREALPVFKEMAAEAHEDMHPVSVEFLLDGDKAVFYFEAEERIDFRELVRKLAAHFHVRIDMRQIGVRDEARMVGGLGHCGQELCCKRLGGEFCPVSIRMAKEQGLSLNPQKISGLCGRLMCCLRYEFDAYKDFKGRAPKLNATVHTPAGPAKVVDHDVPKEIISLKIEGEKPVKVPLADFDPAPEGATRPNTVGEEAWEVATTVHSTFQGESLIFSTSQFTGSDKLAEGAKVRHTGGHSKKGDEGGRSRGGSSDRGRSRRSGRGGSSSEAAAAVQPPRRRRRSTKLAAGEDGHALERVSTSRGEGAKDGASREGAAKRVRRVKDGAATERRDGGASPKQGQGKNGGRKSKGGARPGQKSSGLRQHEGEERRGAQGGSRAKEGSQGASHGSQGGGRAAEGRDTTAAARGAEGGQRKPRRRRRSSNRPKGDGAANGGPAGGGTGGGSSAAGTGGQSNQGGDR